MYMLWKFLNMFCVFASLRGSRRLHVSLYRARWSGRVTGVDRRTITRLKKNVVPASKKCRKTRKDKVIFDSFDKGVLRRTVKSIFQDKNRLSTMAVIHQEMKKRLNFTGSQEQLRRIMRETGFTWKKLRHQALRPCTRRGRRVFELFIWTKRTWPHSEQMLADG